MVVRDRSARIARLEPPHLGTEEDRSAGPHDRIARAGRVAQSSTGDHIGFAGDIDTASRTKTQQGARLVVELPQPATIIEWSAGAPDVLSNAAAAQSAKPPPIIAFATNLDTRDDEARIAGDGVRLL